MDNRARITLTMTYYRSASKPPIIGEPIMNAIVMAEPKITPTTINLTFMTILIHARIKTK